MAMDASLFADHEREFLELTKTLQERVAAAGHGDIAGDPKATLRALESSHVDAVAKLRDMELEVRGMGPSTKRALGAKIMDYRKLLDGIKADLRRTKDKSDRDSLLSGSRGAATYGASLSDESRQYHGKMEATTARASAGTAMLADAVAQMSDIDASADATMGALATNRDTIDRTRGRLGEVNSAVGLAHSILGRMQGRETRFKACIIFFALVVVILIGVIIYFAFFNK